MSDTHFCQKSIIPYCKRPFSSIDEMNETLIQKWNEIVKPGDLIYHLGDFTWHGTVARIQKLCDRLNGKKILIFGNHDDKNALKNSGCFKECYHYFSFKFNGIPVILSHFPFYSWDGSHRGNVMLHGHVHQTKIKLNGKHFNVGVCNSPTYSPFTIEDILKVTDKQQLGTHHE